MNILMITENDPAGMGIAFCNAVNRYTDHNCRLITTAEKYNFEFEKDIHVPDLMADEFEGVASLLENADIFHFHILSDENMRIGPLAVKDYIDGKVLLHHHHGHPHLRSHPEIYREKYRRLKRRVVVSTPDLLKLLPEAVWLPNLVPINDPNYLPVPSGAEKGVTVCHSPTRKDLKNTATFLRVVNRLMDKHAHLSCRLVENTPHEECLRIKQVCDIHFDHMQGYYGVSSLESLSQGKPVIAGLDQWNMSCIASFTGTAALPWIVARNQSSLADKLEQLVQDHDHRRKTGQKSRLFMENYWSEKHVVKRLLSIYESSTHPQKIQDSQ